MEEEIDNKLTLPGIFIHLFNKNTNFNIKLNSNNTNFNKIIPKVNVQNII